MDERQPSSGAQSGPASCRFVDEQHSRRALLLLVEQELLLPPSLRERLPDDHLAWFVIDAVAQLDLAASMAPTATTVIPGRRMIRR